MERAFNAFRRPEGRKVEAATPLISERGPTHLLRVLGLAFGLAVGIGGMIGGGILNQLRFFAIVTRVQEDHLEEGTDCFYLNNSGPSDNWKYVGSRNWSFTDFALLNSHWLN